MKLPVFGLLLVGLATAFTGFASQSRDLELSPTLILRWDSTLGMSPHYMPSTGFFVFKGHRQNQNFEGEVWRKTVGVVATPAGVQRYWAESNQLAEHAKAGALDLGCQPLRSGTFQCRRATAADGGSADLVVWNRNHDLFYLHVKTESGHGAQAVLDSFQVVLK